MKRDDIENLCDDIVRRIEAHWGDRRGPTKFRRLSATLEPYILFAFGFNCYGEHHDDEMLKMLVDAVVGGAKEHFAGAPNGTVYWRMRPSIEMLGHQWRVRVRLLVSEAPVDQAFVDGCHPIYDQDVSDEGRADIAREKAFDPLKHRPKVEVAA